jgi:hypothetical protein
MMLYNALHNAGHHGYHTTHVSYDLYKDEILVRFDSGKGKSRSCVNFNVPAGLFDPVAYAQKQWPHWFVDKSTPNEEQKI